MGTVRLLDCTLRDGGHINQGNFGKNVIKATIDNLVKAKIDVIEAGFLWDTETGDDVARFHTISELKKYLPKDMGNSKISLMADNVDLSHLEPYDGTVEYIRLSFRRTEFEWAEKTFNILKEKGYKVFINPIHGSAFTDQEYLEIIEKVNRIQPYGFAIVDTFGAMRQSDLGRIYYLIEHNLDKNIVLGVHLHENLGLAYSLGQYILNIVSPVRDVIIDGSLFGMGKVPGNLCIEQFMDYMNNEYDTSYAIEPVYDAIDEFIMPIYEHTKWGYSIPYALSAQCSVHRTYAEYLTKKERLKTKDISRLLKEIEPEKAEIYDKDYIEAIYNKYMDSSYDDSESFKKFKKAISDYDKIVIIAPGSSLKDCKLDKDLLENSCTISVNFMYDEFDTTYHFFSNAKRYRYDSDMDMSKMIITSNLIEDVDNAGYIISRNELVYHNDIFCDDSTLMLLNLLKQCYNKKIYIAGFDGFIKGNQNFYESSLERKVRDDDYDQNVRIDIIKSRYSMLDVEFLTPSIYADAFKG